LGQRAEAAKGGDPAKPGRRQRASKGKGDRAKVDGTTRWAVGTGETMEPPIRRPAQKKAGKTIAAAKRGEGGGRGPFRAKAHSSTTQITRATGKRLYRGKGQERSKLEV